MVCVRPGVELVRASPFTPSKLLSKLDLPTFERPIKATSGRPSRRNESGVAALATNLAPVIFIAGRVYRGRVSNWVERLDADLPFATSERPYGARAPDVPFDFYPVTTPEGTLPA